MTSVRLMLSCSSVILYVFSLIRGDSIVHYIKPGRKLEFTKKILDEFWTRMNLHILASFLMILYKSCKTYVYRKKKNKDLILNVFQYD